MQYPPYLVMGRPQSYACVRAVMCGVRLPVKRAARLETFFFSVGRNFSWLALLLRTTEDDRLDNLKQVDGGVSECRSGGTWGLVWAAMWGSARGGTLSFPRASDVLPSFVREECEGAGLFAYVCGTWRSGDCATQIWGGETWKEKKRSYKIMCVNCEFALPQSIVSRVFVRCLSYTTRGFLSSPYYFSYVDTVVGWLS